MDKLLLVISICIIFSFAMLNSVSAEEQPLPKYLIGLDKHITKTMEEWKAPGVAIAIVKDGKTIYAKGFGYRDIKNKLKVTPETLFAIGSTTKAFTAVAIGMLVDEKKLDLDKPVKNYIPFFQMYDPVATELLSTRDILSHRSGLPRHDAICLNSPYTRKELAERLKYLEPNKQLREMWQYSNVMYMMAGYEVDLLSGKKWEEFVKERIIDPIGMSSTVFSPMEMQANSNYSLPYSVKEDLSVKEVPFDDIGAFGPAGSINSNVVDMSKWLIMHLNKGKYNNKQIVSETFIKEMQRPQMVMPGSKVIKESFYDTYGFAWIVSSYSGHLLLNHSGSISGFKANILLLPNDNMGVVVLSSGETNVPEMITANIMDRLLGNKIKPWNDLYKNNISEAMAAEKKAIEELEKNKIPDTTPSHMLEDYAGKYDNPGYGPINIKLNGDHLQLDYRGKLNNLSHYNYDFFKVNKDDIFANMLLEFTYNEKGEIDTVLLPLEPEVKPIVFTKTKE